MEIKSIKIKNFRGIESKAFRFNDQFNVIIGENAVGKTSLMEAITVGLGGFVKGLNYKNGRSITKDDIRIISYSNNIKRAEISKIDITADLLGEEFSWQRQRQFDAGLNDLELYAKVYNYGKFLAFESKSGRFTTLPMISYYGTGRLMKENDSEFNPQKTNQRIDGYNKALNPNSNYKTLLSWFKATEISVYKSGKGIDVLQSVKRAVRNSFEEIETLYYDNNNDLLSILLKGKEPKESKPISTLSDGQKNLIGLIGDIALRCVLLNPHFGEIAHEKTPGIILIDELDLHLHPNWQKKIVETLKTTFPKMQFIATTHSPFIIQSLKNNELIDLQGKDLDTDYINKSIEEIASEEMGVNIKRSEIFNRMMKTATDYFNLIHENRTEVNQTKLGKIKKQLDEYELIFNEDPAYVAQLKIERKMKGL
jgi:predicted ATP-binding protein involved in virulence